MQYPIMDLRKREYIVVRVDKETYEFVLDSAKESNISQYVRKLIDEKRGIENRGKN